RGRLAHVRAMVLDAHAMLLRQCPAEFADGIGIAEAIEHDVDTACRQRTGDGEADACGVAGDEGAFSCGHDGRSGRGWHPSWPKTRVGRKCREPKKAGSRPSRERPAGPVLPRTPQSLRSSASSSSLVGIVPCG